MTFRIFLFKRVNVFQLKQFSVNIYQLVDTFFSIAKTVPRILYIMKLINCKIYKNGTILYYFDFHICFSGFSITRLIKNVGG